MYTKFVPPANEWPSDAPGALYHGPGVGTAELAPPPVHHRRGTRRGPEPSRIRSRPDGAGQPPDATHEGAELAVAATSDTAKRASIITRYVVGVGSLILLLSLLWLSLWATLVPAAWGWSPITVMSGSMEPTIGTGDVVIATSAGDDLLGPGTVIVFEHGSGTGNVIHRVVEVYPDGSYVTRGDANRRRDSTPVPHETVKGVGRIVVPAVGMPFVWAERGQWAYLAAAVVALLAAMWASRWAILEEFSPWLGSVPAAAASSHVQTSRSGLEEPAEPAGKPDPPKLMSLEEPPPAHSEDPPMPLEAPNNGADNPPTDAPVEAPNVEARPISPPSDSTPEPRPLRVAAATRISPASAAPGGTEGLGPDRASESACSIERADDSWPAPAWLRFPDDAEGTGDNTAAGPRSSFESPTLTATR